MTNINPLTENFAFKNIQNKRPKTFASKVSAVFSRKQQVAQSPDGNSLAHIISKVDEIDFDELDERPDFNFQTDTANIKQIIQNIKTIKNTLTDKIKDDSIEISVEEAMDLYKNVAAATKIIEKAAELKFSGVSAASEDPEEMKKYLEDAKNKLAPRVEAIVGYIKLLTKNEKFHSPIEESLQLWTKQFPRSVRTNSKLSNEYKENLKAGIKRHLQESLLKHELLLSTETAVMKSLLNIKTKALLLDKGEVYSDHVKDLRTMQHRYNTQFFSLTKDKELTTKDFKKQVKGDVRARKAERKVGIFANRAKRQEVKELKQEHISEAEGKWLEDRRKQAQDKHEFDLIIQQRREVLLNKIETQGQLPDAKETVDLFSMDADKIISKWEQTT